MLVACRSLARPQGSMGMMRRTWAKAQQASAAEMSTWTSRWMGTMADMQDRMAQQRLAEAGSSLIRSGGLWAGSGQGPVLSAARTGGRLLQISAAKMMTGTEGDECFVGKACWRISMLVSSPG